MPDPARHSILCPSCRKLISTDEPRCPHCGISRPGSLWKNNLWTRGFRHPDQFIKIIIYVNIGMFVISILLSQRPARSPLNPLALFAPGSNSLLLLGATGVYPIDQWHRWWSLVSASYLHSNLLHILFNMVALHQLAPLIVREYGLYRMFALYTVSGVIGFWISYLAGVAFTIGASAAVCGLIGAALYYGKSRGGVYGQSIYRQVGSWAIGLFLFGLLVPGINNWGHGGGILAGALTGYLLGYREKRPERLLDKMLSGGCMALTATILAWAAVSGMYYRMAG